MCNNLGNIVIDGKYMNLNSLSIKKLKEVLSELNHKEANVKQELDSILKRLV